MLHASSTPSSFPSGMPAPRDIRALLLDDSNFDRARIRRLARKTNLSIELDEVDSIAQLDAAVARESYDLVLIDYRLPVGDGMQALEHVMQHEGSKTAGKIMITGDHAQQTAVEALRGGCHDFLTKEDMSVEALRKAMMNAQDAARARHEQAIQFEHQKEIIRQGLVEAMKDGEVQNNVISLVRQQFGVFPTPSNGLDIADMDALLNSLGDDDDFVFH